MRRLLTIAVLAVAAFAVAVPSASGARYDPNPDFPHDDFDPANWAFNYVVNEERTDYPEFGFTNMISPLNWAHWGGDIWWWDNYGRDCAHGGDVSGQFISGSGQVHLNEADMIEPNCYGARNLPWEGFLCEHLPTGDLWVRMEISVNRWPNLLHTGEVFFKVDLQSETMRTVPGSDLFNHQALIGQITTRTELYVTFNLVGLPENATTEVDMPGNTCLWPEFQQN